METLVTWRVKALSQVGFWYQALASYHHTGNSAFTSCKFETSDKMAWYANHYVH